MQPSPPIDHRVDRLWPDPVANLSLDEAMADFVAPTRTDRPAVAINMVTSIDGRAQLHGTADGLAGRADRRLMRLYRARFDAVGSGAGTLRSTGVWLRVGNDLAARRVAEGRTPNPVGVVIAGTGPIDVEAAWFRGDEPRLLMVGSASPLSYVPPGTELLRAPTERPAPRWVLDQLAERRIASFLLEGGPRINTAFLADGLIDEVYWTVGAQLLGTEALPMIAAGGPVSPIPEPDEPRSGRLVTVLRHEDELFLRYRFDGAG